LNHRRLVGWLLFGTVVLTAVVHAGALGAPLTFDDAHLILGNSLLLDSDGLWRLLLEPGLTAEGTLGDHYRPVLMLSLWVDFQLWGTEPWGYRLTNLLLHLANGALAFFLVRRVLEGLASRHASWAALFAAGVFLLHPIQGIVIGMVLKRNTSLCTLFLFSSLLLFLRAPLALSRWQRLSRHAESVLLAALALLSKEDGIIAPGLVLLLGVLGPDRLLSWRTAARIAPYLVVPAVYLLTRFPHQVASSGEASALGHLLAQPLALARYLGMLVDPGAIAGAYDLEPVSQPIPWGRVAALIVVVLVLGLGLWRLRRRALDGFVVVWAALWLAPASSVFPLLLTMDEVRCYGAFLFLYAAVGLGLERLGDWIRARLWGWRSASLLARSPCLFVGVFLLANDLELGVLRKDPIAYWRHAVERHPESKLGHANLCAALADAGKAEEAIGACSRAVRLYPAGPSGHSLLADSLARTGRAAEADRVLAEAQRALPHADILWTTEGLLAWERADLGRARRAFERAWAGKPGKELERLYLADVLLRQGEPARAAEVARGLDRRVFTRPKEWRLWESVRERQAKGSQK
jgi:tetratricopeptide (TPR) repeat protein